MWWFWLFGLLVVLGITLVVVVLVRVLGGGINRSGYAGLGGRPPGPGQARRILDERYARGELSTEEYREHLQELREDA